ncbi:hypothetical protein NEOLI_005124 [Neolecta irregularis DAH-3]|uniref:Transmembrane protein 135 N-terminal domain-containing protein n=1 Tax=Neolecta irregularis (strain DAH-3) TaxID=1198029 RepID=A0A1U7LM74_NEOID|nr:hypothetical protein NEOLI_005124 [Neolecta irregularis DAH-3]|eukprot:OLL23766.1 hypothetical protein NEOLI_005124 [Neolecta irregularis DAH-3]
MYAYFYSPEKLSPSYNSWINKMSTLDKRIVVMFKKLHDKKIQFGQPSSDRSFEDLAFDLGLDPKMGSIEENDFLPCQVIHSNISGSCKVHIAYRWLKGFESSIAIYVPLSLMLALRDPTTKNFKRALTSAIRSSAFLATFITNGWVGICATRSIIGPKLFPNVNRNRYDGMIGPSIGSFLSGWSILIETPKRRGELALFVVPKALTVVLPKSLKQQRIIETVIFGLSTGVIIRSLIDGKGRKVRGVFGKMLHWIMNA